MLLSVHEPYSAVYTVVYTAVPCIRPVHGPYRAVGTVAYTALDTGRVRTQPSVCMCTYAAMYTAVWPCIRPHATYTCQDSLSSYTAVWTCTRPYGRVHGRVDVYTAVYRPCTRRVHESRFVHCHVTAMCTARKQPCRRPVNGRVHGPCTQPCTRPC